MNESGRGKAVMRVIATSRTREVAAGSHRIFKLLNARVVATLIVAVTILCWKLSDLDDRALWFDEAFSWRLTRFSWTEMLDRAARDVHPPLYYIILKSWTSAFGDSVFALRSLSTLWFVVAMAGACLLARESTLRDSGSLAVLMLVPSAFLLRYAQEVRMYTQLLAILLFSNWALLRALGRGKRAASWWIAYVASATAMSYTHYMGLFSLIGQVTFAVGMLALRARFRPITLMRDPALSRAAAAGGAIVTLYLPWIPVLMRQRAQVSANYWAVPITQESPLRLEFWRVVALRCFAHDRPQLPPDYTGLDNVYLYLGYALIAAVVGVLIGLAWQRNRLTWLLITGILIPIVLSIVNSYRIGRNLIEYRYLIGPVSMLIIGMAIILAHLAQSALRWVAALLIAANMFMGAAIYQKALGLAQHSELHGIAAEIGEGYLSGDVVLAAEPLDFFGLMYYTRGRCRSRQLRDSGSIIGHFTGGPIFVEEDFLDEVPLLRGSARRIWIVARADSRPQWTRFSWRMARESRYNEAIRWRGPLFLQLWERLPTEPT